MVTSSVGAGEGEVEEVPRKEEEEGEREMDGLHSSSCNTELLATTVAAEIASEKDERITPDGGKESEGEEVMKDGDDKEGEREAKGEDVEGAVRGENFEGEVLEEEGVEAMTIVEGSENVPVSI